jgi:hypothetical protein
MRAELGTGWRERRRTRPSKSRCPPTAGFYPETGAPNRWSGVVLAGERRREAVDDESAYRLQVLILPVQPMVARPATGLPTGAGWAFEPKADGFLN